MAVPTKTPPFPPSGQFLDAIKSSARSLRLASNIAIRTEDIHRLLRSEEFATSFSALSTSHGVTLPLKFPSVLAELNVLSILSLLNFGSSYDTALRRATGRSAWDTIRAFVLSLYLTSSVGGEGDLLCARGMQHMAIDRIAELMGVSIHVEKPHDTIPGLTIGVLGGPLYDFVTLVTAAMNDTGGVLVDLGYPSLGAFVLEALRGSSAMMEQSGTDFILERLVRAIPAFRDMALIDDQPIYCFRNALFLLHAIETRFGTVSPPPFPIPNTAAVCFFADGVLGSSLVHLGLIDFTSSAHDQLSSLSPRTNPGTKLAGLSLLPLPQDIVRNTPKLGKESGVVLTAEQAYVLRGASIDACAMIIETATSIATDDGAGTPDRVKDITLARLDLWARAVVKGRLDYEDLDIFRQQSSSFF